MERWIADAKGRRVAGAMSSEAGELVALLANAYGASIAAQPKEEFLTRADRSAIVSEFWRFCKKHGHLENSHKMTQYRFGVDTLCRAEDGDRAQAIAGIDKMLDIACREMGPGTSGVALEPVEEMFPQTLLVRARIAPDEPLNLVIQAPAEDPRTYTQP